MMEDLIPASIQLVIHAQSKVIPGHERKFNVPKASEVADSIVNEQYGKLDIVLRLHGCLNRNGSANVQLMHLGNRMYDSLAYPLLFPYGNEVWHSLLRYTYSKGRLLKVSRVKHYCRLLYQPENEFKLIICSGRLSQQYLCEIFVKVECE